MNKELQEIVETVIQNNVYQTAEGGLGVYIVGSKQTDIAGILWQHIENHVQNRGLTCRWDWVQTWLEYYADVVNYWFVIGLKDDQPIGITLITEEKHRKLPLPVHAYHVGTNGEPYSELIRMVNNKILIPDEFKANYYTCLFKAINSYFHWEEIIFDEYNEDEAKILLSVLKNTKLKIRTDRELTLYYDFTKNPATPVLDTLDRETRYTIKRSLKAFDGDITVEWAEDENTAIDILDELIHLYNATWRKLGKRGMFASERFTLFQRAIIPKLSKDKAIILFRAKSKQYGTLGCLYLFIDNGMAYGYQLGINDFQNVEFVNINKKRLRTGYILHTLCMEECRKRGIHGYNFSLGVYQYKKDLSNAEQILMNISLQKGIKPAIREGILNLHEKVNASKKTPLPLILINKLLKR